MKDLTKEKRSRKGRWKVEMKVSGSKTTVNKTWKSIVEKRGGGGRDEKRKRRKVKN